MIRCSRNRVPARMRPGVSNSTLLIERMICGHSTMSATVLKAVSGRAATVLARASCIGPNRPSLRSNCACGKQARIGPAQTVATLRDRGDVPSLVMRRFEFERRGHARAICADDGRRAVGGGAVQLLDSELAFERIGQADDDESEMQQHDMERENCRFLAAVLARGCGEHGADLS